MLLTPPSALLLPAVRRLSLRTLVALHRVGVRGYRTGSSSLRGEPPSWWRVAASFPPLGPRLGSETSLVRDQRDPPREGRKLASSDLGEGVSPALPLSSHHLLFHRDFNTCCRILERGREREEKKEGEEALYNKERAVISSYFHISVLLFPEKSGVIPDIVGCRSQRPNNRFALNSQRRARGSR